MKIFLILLLCGTAEAADLRPYSLSPAAGDTRYVNIDGDTMTGQLNGTSAVLTGSLTASTLTVTGANFSVGGSTLVVSAGKVGIGATPTERLHIKDNDTANDLRIQLQKFTTDSTLGSYFAAQKSHSATLGTLTTTVDTELLGGFLFAGVNTANTTGTAVVIKAVQNGAATANARTPADLSFLVSDGTDLPERMRISKSGNLGIGTTAPDTKLHISSGTLKIDGNVATSISVNGSVVLKQVTAASIAALAPGAIGAIIMCTDCTNPYTICASTHASTAGSWIIAGSAGSGHCQ